MNHETSPFVLIDNIDAESLLSKAKVCVCLRHWFCRFLSFDNCRFLSTPSTINNTLRKTSYCWCMAARKKTRTI